MTGTILFLDDSLERCDAFRARCPHAEIVTTAAACIAKLKGGYWDEVHLDHDLGDETFCDSKREDTGMEVVRWACLNKPDVLTFVVHTFNLPAGAEMVRALEASDYRVLRIPFGAWGKFDY